MGKIYAKGTRAGRRLEKGQAVSSFVSFRQQTVVSSMINVTKSPLYLASPFSEKSSHDRARPLAFSSYTAQSRQRGSSSEIAEGTHGLPSFPLANTRHPGFTLQ